MSREFRDQNGWRSGLTNIYSILVLLESIFRHPWTIGNFTKSAIWRFPEEHVCNHLCELMRLDLAPEPTSP